MSATCDRLSHLESSPSVFSGPEEELTAGPISAVFVVVRDRRPHPSSIPDVA